MTTTTTTDRLAEVLQCDREAAADIWRDMIARPGECIAEKQIRFGGGMDEMPLTQAFARHRIAAIQSQQAKLKTVLDREAETQRRHDAKVDTLQAEIELMQAAIAWANNSLFGSHNFFLGLNGGPPDEHHLDRPIEDLKSRANKEWTKAESLQEALKDVLAHLVAANSLLSRSPKTAAPSDTMFDQMLLDYANSIERGRAALNPGKERA